MRRQCGGAEILGGMRAVHGGSSFARGNAVLAARDRSTPLLEVRAYEGDVAVGDALSAEDWKQLLETGHAVSLTAPCPAVTSVALWVLRSTFPERERFVGELTLREALVASELAADDGHGPVLLALVREDRGNPLRDDWARETFDAAWTHAARGRWTEGLNAVDVAFVVGRGLTVERVALRSLALEQVGRKTAADGLLEFAAKSRGPDFGQRARDMKEQYARQVLLRAPSLTKQRATMAEASRNALRKANLAA